MDNKRIIKTGLPNEKKYGEILASVVGQMSDGIWENTPRMTGYWSYAECNTSSVDIVISNSYWSRYTRSCNPYVDMTDSQIKNFFANKVKQIALIEMQDNYERKVKEKIFGKYPTDGYRYFRDEVVPENEEDYELNDDGFWCRKDDKWKQPILTKEQVVEIKKLYDEYDRYIKENPFIKKGKFKADDSIELVYLNYNERVTLADAYFVYKQLKSK